MFKYVYTMCKLNSVGGYTSEKLYYIRSSLHLWPTSNFKGNLKVTFISVDLKTLYGCFEE